MFNSINGSFQNKKDSAADDQMIVESVIEDAELLEDDEEMVDGVDVESIPDEIYDKVDKSLDTICDDKDFDDTEIDEMLEDDLGDEESIGVVISECAQHLIDGTLPKA